MYAAAPCLTTLPATFAVWGTKFFKDAGLS
jgi:hypothetical protein